MTSVGSPMALATVGTSWPSSVVVHGDGLLMSSRYGRRSRRATRKRAARRPAAFRHDFQSSMPGCTIRMVGARLWSAARMRLIFV